jgi:hypothetical protein
MNTRLECFVEGANTIRRQENNAIVVLEDTEGC